MKPGCTAGYIEGMSRLPIDFIPDGYDVHVVYTAQTRPAALALFAAFLAYVESDGIPHQRAIDFAEPVGPWPTPMWQILLRNPDPVALERDLGRCVAWMMINRGALSVMIHPNTARDGDFGGGHADHSRYHLWMGAPLDLKLSIFEG